MSSYVREQKQGPSQGVDDAEMCALASCQLPSWGCVQARCVRPGCMQQH